jgi:hypothetical protein
MVNAELKAMGAPMVYQADQFVEGASRIIIQQLETKHPGSIYNIGRSTKPPIIWANLSCIRKSTPPKAPFESCPMPHIDSRLYDITDILSYSLTSKRITFLVAFEKVELRRWIDYTVLKKLEPKHIFKNWLRGVFKWHPDDREHLWQEAKKLGFDHELDAMAGVGKSTRGMRRSEQLGNGPIV